VYNTMFEDFMTMTVKDTLLYYMTQYSLEDHHQSFEAMGKDNRYREVPVSL
jgi:hypothetical protein